MHDPIGHNHRIALHADRDVLCAALSVEKTRLHLARAASLRAMAELERECWCDNAHAPFDRAHAAKEALRAAQARRARLRDECVELIDHDDLAA